MFENILGQNDANTTTTTPAVDIPVTVQGFTVQGLEVKLQRLAELETEVVRLSTAMEDWRTATYELKARAKDAIVSVVEAVTGDSVPDDLDDDQLVAVNEALDSIGVDPFTKTYTVEVYPVLEPSRSVLLKVEASSEDNAKDRVEDGEYDEEICDELGINSSDVNFREHNASVQ